MNLSRDRAPIRRAVLVSALALLLGAGQVAGAAVQVELAYSQQQGWSVKSGGQEWFRGGDLKDGVRAEHSGVHFRKDIAGPYLAIESGADVEVTVATFPEWVIHLPGTNSVRVRVDDVKHLVDMGTSMTNEAPVKVTFPDGAWATMGFASYGRYDVMKDGSYYFSGKGRVNSQNADGQKRGLAPYSRPMVGGPLVPVGGTDNGPRMKRILPMVNVAMTGHLRDELVAATEGSQVKIPTGSRQRLRYENGAEVEVGHDAENGQMTWHVIKGCIEIFVPDVRCWRGTSLTDQSGGLRWDGESQALDVLNYTAEGVTPANREILCALSRNINSSVSSGAVLQYLQVEECDTFSASAERGDVTLHNERTGTTTKLDLTTVVVQNDRAPGAGGGAPDARLTWAGDSPVQVSGTSSTGSVEEGGRRTFHSRNGGDLEIGFDGGGVVRVTAVFGDQTIEVGPLNNWTFTVTEGDSILIQTGGRRDVYVLQAAPGNLDMVTSLSPDGLSPRIPAGASLTFILGQGLTTVQQYDGLLVFFELGSGENAFAFGSGEIAPTSMDARGTAQPFGELIGQFGGGGLVLDPRIPQPPVSTVR